MSDQDGGDRPRWEGFPGGVDPVQYPGESGGEALPPADLPPADLPPAGLPPVPPPAAGQPPLGQPPLPAEPEPPQFPVQPVAEETTPIPLVGSTPVDPTGSGLGPRRARSRAAAPPTRDTSRLVALVCAVAVVLVGIGFAFVACNNDDVTPAGDAPVVPLGGTSLTPSSTASVPGSPSSSAVVSSPTPKSSTATATPSRDVEPSPRATATRAAGTKQPVTVLNSTRITGLAARVADDIEDGGWVVTKTTNWTGQQPSVSTIYYLPGAKNKASAQLFAKKFDVARAVKPALPGMTSNLTLVLTSDAS